MHSNNRDNYYNLGYIYKTHGYKGELYFYLDVDFPEKYAHLKSVFIENKGQLVPYRIEKISITNKRLAIVKLENINTIEEAKVIAGAELYLPIEMLPTLSNKKFYFHEIINFKVIDEKYGDIGIIEKVLDFPYQTVLQVTYNSKEILIPVVNEIVKNVDRENKILRTKIPEGLIEVY